MSSPADCVFCKIRDQEIPSVIIYEDGISFVIRDIEPKAPIHLLVIPKEHFTRLVGLSPEFYETLGAMFTVAQEMARRESIADSGYRLVINQGGDAGQQVDHLHLHVLGGGPLGGMG